jgi:hypothetical protein
LQDIPFEPFLPSRHFILSFLKHRRHIGKKSYSIAITLLQCSNKKGKSKRCSGQSAWAEGHKNKIQSKMCKNGDLMHGLLQERNGVTALE